MMFIKITAIYEIDGALHRGGSYIDKLENIVNFADMIDDGDEENKYLIEPTIMTGEEFETLPEFNGF